MADVVDTARGRDGAIDVRIRVLAEHRAVERRRSVVPREERQAVGLGGEVVLLRLAMRAAANRILNLAGGSGASLPARRTVAVNEPDGIEGEFFYENKSVTFVVSNCVTQNVRRSAKQKCDSIATGFLLPINRLTTRSSW
jgi:hypothetical protein